MRIVDYFLNAADQNPESIAFIDGGQAISYADARKTVMRISARLSVQKQGDAQKHVAILSPNDHLVSLLQLGINQSDNVWLSLHSRNTVEVQIETLEKLDCDILFFHSTYEEPAKAILSALGGDIAAVCMDRDSELGQSLENWLGDNSEAELAAPEEPLHPALMQPTGGTTGPSKAVVHTHRSMEMAILAIRQSFGFGPQSTYLAAAPLTHAGGIFALAALCSGAKIVIVPGFTVDGFFDLLPGQKVSHLFLPPTAVYAVLADPRIGTTDFSSLTCFATGAAPFAPEKFKEAVRRFGPVLYESYGQSECLFPMLVKKPEDYMCEDGSFDDEAVASAGRPVDCVRLAIMDDEGKLLNTDEHGEIVVRTSMVMAGYYKRPEETDDVSKFGWHHTTDIGSIDRRGLVTIRDRKKDMIVSGGFNLYPAEIEAVISAHPAVLDCAVVGVPDRKWGEAVKAVIQLKPEHALTEDDVIILCKEELGSLKAPKFVEFWDDLPRSAVGKVLKKDIRARFWQSEWRAV